MTLSERRYYRIATGISILLHAVLLLCVMPELGWLGSVNQMEMISAGIVELNPGTPVKASDIVAPDGQPAVAAAPQTEAEIVASRPQKEAPPEPQKQPLKAKDNEVKKDKTTLKKEDSQEKSVKPVEKLADQKNVKPKEQQPKQAVAQPKEPSKKQSDQKHDENVKDASRPESKIGSKTKPETADHQTGKTLDTQNGAKDENGKPEASGGKIPVAQKLGSGKDMIASGLDIEINYPKNALNEGKEGNVEVRVFVKQDGSIEKIEPIQLSGDSRFDNKTLNHIKQNIKFIPYKQNYFVDIAVNFNIDNGAPMVNINAIQSETRL